LQSNKSALFLILSPYNLFDHFNLLANLSQNGLIDAITFFVHALGSIFFVLIPISVRAKDPILRTVSPNFSKKCVLYSHFDNLAGVMRECDSQRRTAKERSLYRLESK